MGVALHSNIGFSDKEAVSKRTMGRYLRSLVTGRSHTPCSVGVSGVRTSKVAMAVRASRPYPTLVGCLNSPCNTVVSVSCNMRKRNNSTGITKANPCITARMSPARVGLMGGRSC